MFVVQDHEIRRVRAGAENPLDALLWHLPATVWEGTRSAQRTRLSPHWERITGQRTSDALGYGYLEHVHPNDRPRIPIATAHLFETGEPYEAEYRIRVRDGSYRWQLERGVLGEESDTVVGALFDIHERGAGWEEPTRVATMQERMVSVVSHDLRCPLTTVRTALDALKTQVKDPTPTMSSLIGHLDAAARRADHMVLSLMEFARERPDGSLPVTPTVRDLVPVVQDLVEEARMWAPDREIVLTHPDREVMASIDDERVAQAITNLVANALEHAHGRIEIEVSDAPVEVRVSSLGERLTGQQLRTLYSPFHEGGGRGLGLGLWITRQIAIAHGGEVRYRHGKGRNHFVFALAALEDEGATSGAR